MSAVIAERTYTPEDLLTGDGKGYELVDGRLVEKEMGAESSSIAMEIGRLLGPSLVDSGLGWLFGSETGYQCFADDRKRVRKPDLSFVRRSRLPGGRRPKGHVLVPPDLAVEVVSPNDLAYELEVKVGEYLAAGVPTVWVVTPEARTVHVIHADRTGVRLGEQDELTLPELDPSFRCRVADLFTTPAQPTT